MSRQKTHQPRCGDFPKVFSRVDKPSKDFTTVSQCQTDSGILEFMAEDDLLSRHVLILAGERSRGKKEKKSRFSPRTLAEIRPDFTLLEAQLQTLQLFGFSLSQVSIFVGNLGSWNQKAIAFLQDIDIAVITDEAASKFRSGHALGAGLRHIEPEKAPLVINGDLLLDTSHLSMVLGSPRTTMILARQVNWLGEHGTRIALGADGNVLCGKNVDRNILPWRVYAGIMSLSSDVVVRLKKNDEDSNCTAIQRVVGASQPGECSIVEMNSRAVNEPIELRGGSDAAVDLQIRVRKSAEGVAAGKLSNEITWLKALPEEVEAYFPRVLDSGTEAGSSWFEMPYISQMSLRKAAMTGLLSAKSILTTVAEIIQFFETNFYSSKLGPPPSDWLFQTHFSRFHSRRAESERRSPLLRTLFHQETVVINGRKYRNLPELVDVLQGDGGLRLDVTPAELTAVHGDLHFQNILLGQQLGLSGAVFVDPRGELNGSDPFYDFGKLLHSVNGLYDFIHTDQFLLGITEQNRFGLTFELSFPESRTLSTYQDVAKELPHLIGATASSTNVPDWKASLFFSEAMHFATVMQFHLAKDESGVRSAALYLQAVILMNRFVEEFGVESFDNRRIPPAEKHLPSVSTSPPVESQSPDRSQ